MGLVLNESAVKHYETKGYYCPVDILDAEEIAYFRKALENYEKQEGEPITGSTRNKSHLLFPWVDELVRHPKILDPVEDLIGPNILCWNSVWWIKEKQSKSFVSWHQDARYWGLNTDRLVTVWLALSQARVENGCMQVLRGSHHLGRVNHVLSGDQAGADLERVEEARKRLDLVHATMDPGDAMFFHSNTLHASAANNSDHPRWAMICCYNAASNDPYKESHHPRYTKLDKVDDDQILSVGRDHAQSAQTAFADLKADDKSAASLVEEETH